MTDSIVFAVLLVALFLFIEWRRAADEKVNDGKLLKFDLNKNKNHLKIIKETAKGATDAWNKFKSEHGGRVDSSNTDDPSSEGGDRKK